MPAEQIQPRQPLLDGVVPVRQRQPARNNFIGQQSCRGVGGRRLNAFGGQRQSAKTHQFGGLHAFGRGIELDVQLGFQVVRKKLTQPFKFNRRGQ